MKIIWTQKADTQLSHIFEYIASDSTFYAHRAVDKIIECTETISQNPEIGARFLNLIVKIFGKCSFIPIV